MRCLEEYIMINKKNLWFLTLFSLVLVLSIYYVTMPSDVFNTDTVVDSENIDIKDVSVISSMKLEDDALVVKEINDIKNKLTSKDISSDEKNALFEQLKSLNRSSSKEETLENKIKDSCNCENFVKIDGDNVRVVLDSDDASTSNANNIMRLVQSEFDNKMYISVKYN